MHIKKQLTRSFFRMSMLYSFSTPLNILSSIILARTLSVSEFGIFGFALSLATILAIPVSAGLPLLLTREIAAYSGRAEWSEFRGIALAALAWVVGSSLVVIAGIAFTLAVGESGPSLLFAAILVPLLGLNAVRNGILKGLGYPVLAEMTTQVFQPVLLIIGYFLLANWHMASANTVLTWYVSVITMTLLVATVFLWKVNPVPTGVPASFTGFTRWRDSLLNFALVAGTTTLNIQIAVLFVGMFGSEEGVAALRVAERGAQLVLFPLMFLNASMGPFVVRAAQSDDSSELRQIARHSARLAFIVALPIAMILAQFGPWLIGITFGSPYNTSAYLPMLVLLGGHLISIALGNSGVLLAMTGHERYTFYSLLISVALIALASLFLIPSYGAIGAAIGVSLGTVASKGFLYWVTCRKLGIRPGLI